MNERGFTIIELLTVIGIIGILSYLSVTSYFVYKANAGYASAESLVRNARVAASASTADPDRPPLAVAPVSQKVQGPLINTNAANFLPGLQLPHNLKFQVSYEPNCLDSSCVTEFVRADSCHSPEYVSWTKFGDGVEILLEKIGGASCS